VKVAVNEVGPRDGLQNEPTILPPSSRVELVERLSDAGLRRIESVSFVRDELVPPMADAEEVVRRIRRREDVAYAALVLNARGYRRFAAAPLDEVHVALAASEQFNLRNSHATVEESLATVDGIVRSCRSDGYRITVTIATAFGCPFEGAVDPGWVAHLADRIVTMAPDEIVLADTIGVAVPAMVRRLVARISAVTRLPVGLHLHDTRNTGIVNAYAALELGVRSLDSSIGGMGGCPFAPRATGNIATEDLVYMLEGEGIETNVDLDALIRTSVWLEEQLGRPFSGRVYRAGGFASVVG
jgi:isopropylmalate/homocitrate/citramalate synthase